MPTIENQRTRKSTAKKKPTIPTISMDSGDGSVDALNQKVPANKTINLSTDPNTVAGKTKSTRPVADGKRQVVDIKDLAAPKDPNESGHGVDIHKSPADDILGPGGPFEKYVENKTKEMQERMAYEDEKREVEAGEEEERKWLEGEDQEEVSGQIAEDEELEKDAVYAKPTNIKRAEIHSVSNKVVDFAAPEEEPEDDEDLMEEEDDDLVDDLFYDDDDKDVVPKEESEEEVEEEVSTDHDEPAPVVLQEPKQKDTPVEKKKEKIPTTPVKGTKVAFTFDEKDLEDEDIDNADKVDDGLPSDDERLTELKAEITRKIRPKARSLNLSGFTIASKSTTSNRIFEVKEASAGKWVLPTTGIVVESREISGQKIEYLRENMGNNPTQARNRLKVIYDHIITPKPKSFEAWTKSIAYADYDHLFMPIYLAAFSDANYMPQTCEKEAGKLPKKDTGCGKMFLTDNIPVMDLVKFKDDECEKKFWELYNSDRVNPKGLYASEVVPISERFAIQFHEPSLYNFLFEMNAFNREFQEKYNNVIAFMPYIDEIYWIDGPRKTLVKVDYKKYENNTVKNAKSKVIKYSNVLDSLHTDEYTNFVSLVSSISERNDWLSYQIPELTCPECGRIIPAEEMSASGLLFTRHQLGVLANLSIK